MTNKALTWALGIACVVIVALSIHIVHTEYYHHAQQIPSYCQSYEALEKFKADHPTMMITCDNEPE